MDLVIYGAQGIALGAAKALTTLYPRRKVRCFLVTDMGNNAGKLNGIPVLELSQFASCLSLEEKQNIEILIATPENVQAEIEENLENCGLRYHKRLDSDRWAELMKLYHVRLDRFTPLSALPIGYHEPFIRMYIAKSHKDRPLRSEYHMPDWAVPVQAGTSLTEERIAEIQDDMGENISCKNGNYSELSVLYWIWKNKLKNGADDASAEWQYYGMNQYRRMFCFTRDDLLRLVDNDVDVVLPYPMPYEPNIEEHHKRYLKEEDWDALLKALSEKSPAYMSDFQRILEQPFLYNYNIILAKKRIIKEYCDWLFPVLERVEELSRPKGDGRADRYIGYMGETLETLYFMRNNKSLNVVHMESRFLL